MPTLTRILLIDDDAVDRQAVRRALAASDLRWDLTEAANAADGLALAAAGMDGAPFDCVLLDYRLPDMDAFDVLTRLIAPEGGGQAVMMLTGESNPQTAVDLMRAGALDHLAKDEMTPQTLARAIRYARARRGFLAELEEKSAALDALNRQQSLLLSIIGHDLRNPFQVMLGMSEVLSQAVAEKDPARVEARARGIREAAEQAHRLMDDLFTWASLQMASAEVTTEQVELQVLAQSAVEACGAVAARKGVALAVDCGSTQVAAHRAMLATILRNLTANAIKFTPEGGAVTISAGPDGDGAVTLCVADTGVGMDAETVDRLFRLDQRFTTVGTAGETGTGLGLLLCRDLAARLQTALAVESVPGEGTRFTLRLVGASEGNGIGIPPVSGSPEPLSGQ